MSSISSSANFYPKIENSRDPEHGIWLGNNQKFSTSPEVEAVVYNLYPKLQYSQNIREGVRLGNNPRFSLDPRVEGRANLHCSRRGRIINGPKRAFTAVTSATKRASLTVWEAAKRAFCLGNGGSTLALENGRPPLPSQSHQGNHDLSILRDIASGFGDCLIGGAVLVGRIITAFDE
jgi:hypothetical protein